MQEKGKRTGKRKETERAPERVSEPESAKKQKVHRNWKELQTGSAGRNKGSTGRRFWKRSRAKGFAALHEKEAPPTVAKTAVLFIDI